MKYVVATVLMLVSFTFCLARVTSGTAEMTKNAILTDKEIADGLILTCQAHPTSESIYVDYDDV
jgi:ring-1,2-phenylacetyl-CoA epoxidase subunit PaaE